MKKGKKHYTIHTTVPYRMLYIRKAKHQRRNQDQQFAKYYRIYIQ